VIGVLLASTAAAFVNDKLALLVLGGGLGVLAWRCWDCPEDVLGLLFTCFCAAPFLRRIHDFRNGWTPGSLLLVAPYMLFVPVVLRVVRRLPVFRRGVLIPMIVVLVAVLYAFLVGVWKNDIYPATLGLLEWGCGPLVAFYILVSAKPLSTKRLVRWIAVLAFVQFAYALYQWVQPPPWDAAWLMASKMYTSMGKPEPFLMRPCGTLNSTGPLAVFLVWYAVIGISERSFLWTAPGCIAAIVVTQVRAAWIVLAFAWFAMSVLLPSASRSRAILRLLTVVFTLVVLAIPFQSKMMGVLERFETLGNMKGDTSYKERHKLMEMALDYLVTVPEGTGLGSEGRSARATNTGVGGGLDNGFIAIVMVLGWAGAVAYLLSFLIMLGLGLQSSRRGSPEGGLHGVVGIALLVSNAFGTSFSDFPGVVLWCSLAICYRFFLEDSAARLREEAVQALE